MLCLFIFFPVPEGGKPIDLALYLLLLLVKETIMCTNR
jgi:hypothetical protein